MDLLLAFVIAMSVTMALIPALNRLAGRMHVLDAPGPRKVHTRPIPRIGGIAMVIGVVIPLLVWLGDDSTLIAYLVASAVLVAFGVWDDRVSLGYVAKFAGQLFAAVVVVGWGDLLIHSVTLTDRVELPAALGIPLTVLFIVGVTNAINLADGLDGLAGGTTLLSCCAIAMLALTVDDRFVATVAIVMTGSLLGFLRYNTYPARIFMGDGGSQFLGFTVAVLSVQLTQGREAPISSALPLLLLGLPILDTLTVMVQRVAEGRSPFAADRSHLHHRLLALGFDHHEAVIAIYLVQAVLFVAAWLMRYESDITIVATFALFAVAVLCLLLGASSRGWRWRVTASRVESEAAGDLRQRSLEALRECLPVAALSLAGAGTALYALWIAATSSPIPFDVGALALLLAAALILTAFGSPRARIPGWMLHGLLYVGAAVIVFLDTTSLGPGPPRAAELAVIGTVAASVMLYFRMTVVRRFHLTPLDVLVIFVALALPNLPGATPAPRELGMAAIKGVVLFYAVETLLNHSPRSRDVLHGVAALAFTLLAARAFA